MQLHNAHDNLRYNDKNLYTVLNIEMLSHA
jgi:hypothetical protein